MPTMNDIQARARAYADARDKLAELVAALNDGLEQLKRDSLPGIRRAIQRASERQAELKALIEDAPDLFVKPRTVVMHGVRVGFEKGKGRIEFEDADRVVKLIKKHLSGQADVLIATKETPVKKALAQLSVKELKAIGCTVDEAGDVVVIRPVDTDVDKLVTALMKGATEDAEQ